MTVLGGMGGQRFTNRIIIPSRGLKPLPRYHIYGGDQKGTRIVLPCDANLLYQDDVQVVPNRNKVI